MTCNRDYITTLIWGIAIYFLCGAIIDYTKIAVIYSFVALGLMRVQNTADKESAVDTCITIFTAAVTYGLFRNLIEGIVSINALSGLLLSLSFYAILYFWAGNKIFKF